MGYVQDPSLLPGGGGSPGYQPGKQWDVKNKKYIDEPTGHGYHAGMQWRDDAGIDIPDEQAATPKPPMPPAPESAATQVSKDNFSLPTTAEASSAAPSLGGGTTSAPGGGGTPFIPQTPATPAMSGLQMAGGGDQATPGFNQGSAPGGVNPNLGRRLYPNEMSALRSLTY